ncbi:hypothetical protein FHG87_004387 [Trinorchestia longiramus]|nr:hypothetical protein FHG87_004387 [Trinorchestia longiramus]
MNDKCVVCGEQSEGKPLYKKLGSEDIQVDVLTALQELELVHNLTNARDCYICWDCDETLANEYARFQEAKASTTQAVLKQHEQYEASKKKLTKKLKAAFKAAKNPQQLEQERLKNEQRYFASHCLLCAGGFDSPRGFVRFNLLKNVDDNCTVGRMITLLELHAEVDHDLQAKRYICCGCFNSTRRKYRAYQKDLAAGTPSVPAKPGGSTSACGPVTSSRRCLNNSDSGKKVATTEEHAAEIVKLLPPSLADTYKIVGQSRPSSPQAPSLPSKDRRKGVKKRASNSVKSLGLTLPSDSSNDNSSTDVSSISLKRKTASVRGGTSKNGTVASHRNISPIVQNLKEEGDGVVHAGAPSRSKVTTFHNLKSSLETLKKTSGKTMGVKDTYSRARKSSDRAKKSMTPDHVTSDLTVPGKGIRTFVPNQLKAPQENDHSTETSTSSSDDSSGSDSSSSGSGSSSSTSSRNDNSSESDEKEDESFSEMTIGMRNAMKEERKKTARRSKRLTTPNGHFTSETFAKNDESASVSGGGGDDGGWCNVCGLGFRAQGKDWWQNLNSCVPGLPHVTFKVALHTLDTKLADIPEKYKEESLMCRPCSLRVTAGFKSQILKKVAASRGVSVTDIDVSKFKVRVMDEDSSTNNSVSKHRSPSKSSTSSSKDSSKSRQNSSNFKKSNSGSSSSNKSFHASRARNPTKVADHVRPPDGSFSSAVVHHSYEPTFSSRNKSNQDHTSAASSKNQCHYLNRPNPVDKGKPSRRKASHNYQDKSNAKAGDTTVDPRPASPLSSQKQGKKRSKKSDRDSDEDYQPTQSKKFIKVIKTMQEIQRPKIGSVLTHDGNGLISSVPNQTSMPKKQDSYYRKKFDVDHTVKVLLRDIAGDVAVGCLLGARVSAKRPSALASVCCSLCSLPVHRKQLKFPGSYIDKSANGTNVIESGKSESDATTLKRCKTSTCADAAESCKSENGVSIMESCKLENGANTTESSKPENGVDTTESSKPENGVDTTESSKPENGVDTTESSRPENGVDTTESFRPENGVDTTESSKPENGANTTVSCKPENGANTTESSKPENGSNTTVSCKPENGANTTVSCKPENGANTTESCEAVSGGDTDGETFRSLPLVKASCEAEALETVQSYRVKQGIDDMSVEAEPSNKSDLNLCVQKTCVYNETEIVVPTSGVTEVHKSDDVCEPKSSQNDVKSEPKLPLKLNDGRETNFGGLNLCNSITRAPTIDCKADSALREKPKSAEIFNTKVNGDLSNETLPVDSLSQSSKLCPKLQPTFNEQSSQMLCNSEPYSQGISCSKKSSIESGDNIDSVVPLCTDGKKSASPSEATDISALPETDVNSSGDTSNLTSGTVDVTNVFWKGTKGIEDGVAKVGNLPEEIVNNVQISRDTGGVSTEPCDGEPTRGTGAVTLGSVGSFSCDEQLVKSGSASSTLNSDCDSEESGNSREILQSPSLRSREGRREDGDSDASLRCPSATPINTSHLDDVQRKNDAELLCADHKTPMNSSGNEKEIACEVLAFNSVNLNKNSLAHKADLAPSNSTSASAMLTTQVEFTSSATEKFSSNPYVDTINKLDNSMAPAAVKPPLTTKSSSSGCIPSVPPESSSTKSTSSVCGQIQSYSKSKSSDQLVASGTKQSSPTTTPEYGNSSGEHATTKPFEPVTPAVETSLTKPVEATATSVEHASDSDILAQTKTPSFSKDTPAEKGVDSKVQKTVINNIPYVESVEDMTDSCVLAPPNLMISYKWARISLGLSASVNSGLMCSKCKKKLLSKFRNFIRLKVSESMSVPCTEVDLRGYLITFNVETMNIVADPIDEEDLKPSKHDTKSEESDQENDLEKSHVVAKKYKPMPKSAYAKIKRKKSALNGSRPVDYVVTAQPANRETCNSKANTRDEMSQLQDKSIHQKENLENCYSKPLVKHGNSHQKKEGILQENIQTQSDIVNQEWKIVNSVSKDTRLAGSAPEGACTEELLSNDARSIEKFKDAEETDVTQKPKLFHKGLIDDAPSENVSNGIRSCDDDDGNKSEEKLMNESEKVENGPQNLKRKIYSQTSIPSPCKRQKLPSDIHSFSHDSEKVVLDAMDSVYHLWQQISLDELVSVDLRPIKVSSGESILHNNPPSLDSGSSRSSADKSLQCLGVDQLTCGLLMLLDDYREHMCQDHNVLALWLYKLTGQEVVVSELVTLLDHLHEGEDVMTDVVLQPVPQEVWKHNDDTIIDEMEHSSSQDEVLPIPRLDADSKERPLGNEEIAFFLRDKLLSSSLSDHELSLGSSEWDLAEVDFEQPFSWTRYLELIDVDALIQGKDHPPVSENQFSNGLLHAVWRTCLMLNIPEREVGVWLTKLSPVPLTSSVLEKLLSVAGPMYKHILAVPHHLDHLSVPILYHGTNSKDKATNKKAHEKCSNNQISDSASEETRLHDVPPNFQAADAPANSESQGQSQSHKNELKTNSSLTSTLSVTPSMRMTVEESAREGGELKSRNYLSSALCDTSSEPTAVDESALVNSCDDDDSVTVLMEVKRPFTNVVKPIAIKSSKNTNLEGKGDEVSQENNYSRAANDPALSLNQIEPMQNNFNSCVRKMLGPASKRRRDSSNSYECRAEKLPKLDSSGKKENSFDQLKLLALNKSLSITAHLSDEPSVTDSSHNYEEGNSISSVQYTKEVSQKIVEDTTLNDGDNCAENRTVFDRDAPVLTSFVPVGVEKLPSSIGIAAPNGIQESSISMPPILYGLKQSNTSTDIERLRSRSSLSMNFIPKDNPPSVSSSSSLGPSSTYSTNLCNSAEISSASECPDHRVNVYSEGRKGTALSKNSHGNCLHSQQELSPPEAALPSKSCTSTSCNLLAEHHPSLSPSSNEPNTTTIQVASSSLFPQRILRDVPSDYELEMTGIRNKKLIGNSCEINSSCSDYPKYANFDDWSRVDSKLFRSYVDLPCSKPRCSVAASERLLSSSNEDVSCCPQTENMSSLTFKNLDKLENRRFASTSPISHLTRRQSMDHVKVQLKESTQEDKCAGHNSLETGVPSFQTLALHARQSLSKSKSLPCEYTSEYHSCRTDGSISESSRNNKNYTNSSAVVHHSSHLIKRNAHSAVAKKRTMRIHSKSFPPASYSNKVPFLALRSDDTTTDCDNTSKVSESLLTACSVSSSKEHVAGARNLRSKTESPKSCLTRRKDLMSSEQPVSEVELCSQEKCIEKSNYVDGSQSVQTLDCRKTSTDTSNDDASSSQSNIVVQHGGAQTQSLPLAALKGLEGAEVTNIFGVPTYVLDDVNPELPHQISMDNTSQVVVHNGKKYRAYTVTNTDAVPIAFNQRNTNHPGQMVMPSVDVTQLSSNYLGGKKFSYDVQGNFSTPFTSEDQSASNSCSEIHPRNPSHPSTVLVRLDSSRPTQETNAVELLRPSSKDPVSPYSSDLAPNMSQVSTPFGRRFSEQATRPLCTNIALGQSQSYTSHFHKFPFDSINRQMFANSVETRRPEQRQFMPSAPFSASHRAFVPMSQTPGQLFSLSQTFGSSAFSSSTNTYLTMLPSSGTNSVHIVQAENNLQRHMIMQGRSEGSMIASSFSAIGLQEPTQPLNDKVNVLERQLMEIQAQNKLLMKINEKLLSGKSTKKKKKRRKSRSSSSNDSETSDDSDTNSTESANSSDEMKSRKKKSAKKNVALRKQVPSPSETQSVSSCSKTHVPSDSNKKRRCSTNSDDKPKPTAKSDDEQPERVAARFRRAVAAPQAVGACSASRGSSLPVTPPSLPPTKRLGTPRKLRELLLASLGNPSRLKLSKTAAAKQPKQA